MNTSFGEKTRAALFLDRDGVINIDHGHVFRKEDFDLVPGILELIQRANKAGWFVVVVTNQAGIAKGYYRTEDFLRLMDWVRKDFSSKHAHIDAVYYCPHHPEFGDLEKRNCSCRKPAPGMLVQAAKEMGIDLENSVLIGDKKSDILAAKQAGVGAAYLFASGNVNSFAAENFDFYS